MALFDHVGGLSKIYKAEKEIWTMKFIDYYLDRMWEYALGFIFGIGSFSGAALLDRLYIHNPLICAILGGITLLLLVTGTILVHWKAHGRKS